MKRSTSLRRWRSSIAMAGVLLGIPAAAHAQFSIPGLPQIVIDPRNLVQNARQVAQAATQINNQRLQIQYQLRSLAKLSRPNWREIDGLMYQLDVLMQQGEALAYSAANLDEEFRRTFPGYELPTDWVASDAQRTQATRALATLHASLAATRRQMQDIGPGMARLRQIKAQMGGIEGTQQAVELQNTLQAYAAEELMMLRQAVAVQTNAMAVAQAQQVQREMEEQAVLDQILANTLSRPRTHSPGFDGRWRRP
jgi:P-type conjugative transfer protein TrbJ